MDIKQCVNSLTMPLPEDILKRKWAGDLEGAMKAIDIRLQEEMPEMLRARLVCEKERIRRLPTQYPWKRPEALEKLQALMPGATDADLERWELEGRVDFIYIDGEKRYFVRFHKTRKQKKYMIIIKQFPQKKQKRKKHGMQCLLSIVKNIQK